MAAGQGRLRVVKEWSLTAEQRAVVEHPLAPVRIAAGAGTGKTSTIVARLVHLVEDGMEPESALGITFTNKAAEELSDRLRRSLPEHAIEGREVEVTTYHGFAFSLLQEYGAFVGVERDVEVIGPGYVRQLILEALPGRTYRYLDMTFPPARVDEVATLAGQLGDNLATPDDLRALATFQSGLVWHARRELAEIVTAYDVRKRELGVVDYSDLIRLAHRLINHHPSVAAKIRDRHRIVLLDEYQDTAPAQRELLRGVFGDGFPVTAVGDADQTIYEWRGASLANFAGFPDHFAPRDGPAVVTLPLTINHRSGTTVLELANAVRSEIHGEGGFDPLTAPSGTSDGHIAVSWFNDAAQEARWIAEEVRRLRDEDGIEWRDVAVLFRKNRHIALVRDALEAVGVPIEVASLGGLLDVPEVADLHAWLRVLDDPDDAPALLRVLLGSRYRLGLGDIAPLTRWLKAQRPARSDHDERTLPLLEAIDRLDEVDDLRAEAVHRLADFRAAYRELLVVAQGVALDELCRRILDTLDAWAEVESMEPAAGLSARLNLYRFLDLARDWSPLEGRTSLTAFLGYLQLLADEGRADELDTARVGGENAVTLLTVHRAKGLEWDVVFLPALMQRTFPAQSQRYDNPEDSARFLPYALRLDADSLPDLNGSATERRSGLRAHHEAAEWRTAYVAVTRARQRLYLSGAFWQGTKEPQLPSPLIELGRRLDGVVTGPWLDNPETAPSRLILGDTLGAPDPVFADGWESAIRSMQDDPTWVEGRIGHRAAYDGHVNQLRMMVDGLPPEPETVEEAMIPGTSVTGLVTLASCPQRFYWNEIDRLPRRPAQWLARGVEVHRQIELHNLGRLAFDNVRPDLYDTVGDAPSEGAPVGDAVGAFRASRFADDRPRFVEAPIDLQINEARIRGRIDAVYEPRPGHWEIVDFKSGRRRNDPSAVVQLQAYAVAAADGAVSTDLPDSMDVTFAYLGTGAVEEVTAAVTDEWLAEARSRLDDLVAEMKADTFEPTPGPGCGQCDFVRFCGAGTAYLGATPAPPPPNPEERKRPDE
jgi:DNA helicase-2/ATP-dependent DNA helicase PcrA